MLGGIRSTPRRNLVSRRANRVTFALYALDKFKELVLPARGDTRDLVPVTHATQIITAFRAGVNGIAQLLGGAAASSGSDSLASLGLRVDGHAGSSSDAAVVTSTTSFKL